MLFLHGILGTRANWRSVARRIVDADPAWGAILVDLREHGDSLGQPPPHTLRACVADVAELVDALGVNVGGALGHSFGGKVVLEWLATRDGLDTSAWVVDSTPSPREFEGNDSVATDVLKILGTLPTRWDSRESFVEAVVESGQPAPIAQWLSMNLRRTDDGARQFGPDLVTITELIEDYAATDEWDVVETLPRRCSLDFILGGRSSVVSTKDRARFDAIGIREPRLRVHVIEQAGHWVHVDAAESLIALVVEGFASRAPGGT